MSINLMDIITKRKNNMQLEHNKINNNVKSKDIINKDICKKADNFLNFINKENNNYMNKNIEKNINNNKIICSNNEKYKIWKNEKEKMKERNYNNKKNKNRDFYERYGQARYAELKKMKKEEEKKEQEILGWNGRGVNMKPGKVKTDLQKKSNADIILLLEQWTVGYMDNYQQEYTRDNETKTGKINASIHIKEGQQYTRIAKEINNAVIILVPEASMVIGVCYARPEKNRKETMELNQKMFADIKVELELYQRENNEIGILIFGDFNRQEDIWEKIGDIKQKYITTGKGTHQNLKNKAEDRAEQQRIYTKNIEVSTNIIEQTIEKVSDHAQIKIQCKHRKIDDEITNKRSTIPNPKTAELIHEQIRKGSDWNKIDKEIYSNPKMLKKKVKNKQNQINEEQWKNLLEKQATEESVEKIEKTNYEGFKKLIQDMGMNIGSGKDSKEGWKTLKALSKYHLLTKKEGQFQHKVLDKENNIVTGEKMNKEIIDYLKEVHTAKDPKDKLDIQKWDFDIEISTKKAKEISKEISKDKALSWDCIRDKTFKLCKECYDKEDDEECRECRNVIQRIKDVFKKEFWNRSKSITHLHSRLVALDKVAPNVAKPEEAFRPICVSSTIIRLQEASLINKLRKYVKENVHFSQCGFIGGRSCAHNLVRLHMLRKKFKKGIILTIDWRSAYNRTLREGILERLETDNVQDENEQKILKFIQTNQEIKIGKDSTKTDVGLQQGLSTSPQQYVIEMDVQIKSLTDQGIEYCQALADDLLIYITGGEKQLKKAIKIIKEFEKERKQKLNPKKCGIIELGVQRRNRKIPEEVENIPNCTDIGYKYLGVHLTKNQSYEAYMLEKRKKLWSLVSKVKRYTADWELSKKRLIIKSQILPHLDYIGMILQLGNSKDMEKFKASMRRFARVILGLGFNVKNDMVNLMVDVNRENLWIRRLKKIKNDWEKMAGYQWPEVDSICNKEEYKIKKEIDLKKIPIEKQRDIIEILNKFNRAYCKNHKNKRLSTSHLKEHDIELDYDKIEKAIINKEWHNLQIIKEKQNEFQDIN